MNHHTYTALTPLPPMCAKPAACSLLANTVPHDLERVHPEWRHVVVRHAGAECVLDECAPLLPPGMEYAVPSRRHEFRTGRLAAYQLLRDAGVPEERAWIASSGRQPLWPPNFVGSISHSTELVAVALVPAGRQGRSIGIDVEVLAQPASAIKALEPCFDQRELLLLSACQDGLVIGFSVKEAIYKCLYPLVKRFIGFEEAAVLEVCQVRHQLLVQLNAGLCASAGLPSLLTARFAFVEGHVWSGVEIVTSVASSPDSGTDSI